jgi:hypothetical protein
METDREAREDDFANAKAAVLGRRPHLAEGVGVVLVEQTEHFALRFADGTTGEPIGTTAAHFLRLVDGERTVGDIIEAIADEMAIAEAIAAGKAAMAALHEFYVDGVISELRG